MPGGPEIAYTDASAGTPLRSAASQTVLRPLGFGVTSELQRLDERHFEMVHPGKRRELFEVPSGVDMRKPGVKRAVLVKRTNRNGLETTLRWDAQGERLLAKAGPGGRQRLQLDWPEGYPGPTHVRDHTGRLLAKNTYEKRWACGRKVLLLTKVESAGGLVVEYGYRTVAKSGRVAHNLLTTRINGVLQKKQVQADPYSGTMLEMTARTGQTTRFEEWFVPATETQPGRPETHIITTGPQVPGGRQETILAMDAKGRVATLTDALGGKTRYEYRNDNDPDDCGCGSKPKRIVDPLGHETLLRYDERQHITSVTDSLGHTVRLTWTDDNLTSVETADGTTTLGYDEHSNLNLVRDPLGHEKTMNYNALGKLESIRDNLGHETTLSYNASGFLTGRSLPPATSGAVRAQWIYTVDALGRRRSSRDPLGREVRYSYDEADRIREVTLPAVTARARQGAQPEARITYSYRPEGLLASVKAVDGQKTLYDYDDAFRLVGVQEPGDQPPTRLRYDSLGNLLELTNPRQKSTLYTYDALNRLTRRVYPAPGGQETFTYDDASRLLHWQRTGGIGVDYRYDDANRLLGLSCAATGDNVLLGYDDLNRVRTMSDASGTTTYDYLPNSRLKSVTRPGNRTLTYGYDLADRLQTLTDPEGLVTNYTYNDRDELTDVSLDGQTVHYEHDLLGRPTVTSYANGMSLIDGFDERDRLLTRTYRKGGSPLLSLKYAYTQLGQRELSEQITGRGTDLRRYCYTDRRELEASERTVTNSTNRCGVTTKRRYRFDDNQNRTKAGNVTASHNDADQLMASSDGQSFSHNGAGQMTEAGQ